MGEKGKTEEGYVKELIAALKNYFSDIRGKRVGVMFSGGLDSAVIAKLALIYCEAFFYAIGTEDSDDIKSAESAACEMGVKLKTITINEGALNVVRRVISLLNRYDVVDVELGTALRIGCNEAEKDKIAVLLNGQGAEELFAGYYRHYDLYLKDKGSLKKLLEEDFDRLFERDIKRNAIICSCIGYPFLSPEFVKVAKEIPIKLKIRNGKRKYILRKVAEKLGVPKCAYDREKKAMQYGSGLHKYLTQISKAKGYKGPGEYFYYLWSKRNKKRSKKRNKRNGTEQQASVV